MSNAMWLLFLALIMSMFTTVRAEEGTDPEVVILFMFFGLGIGIITMQFLSALGDPLPYTVVVFTAGLLFSLFDANNAGRFVAFCRSFSPNS
jgi:Na+-driven multidrug efflux pump